MSNVLFWQNCSLPAVQRTCQLCHRGVGYRLPSISATLMTHLPCMIFDRRRGVLSSCLSQLGGQNCKLLSKTLLRCTWSRHTLNAEHSRPVWLFTDNLGRSWLKLSSRHSADEVELLRLLQTQTFAAFVVVPTTVRPPSSSTDDTLQLHDVVADLLLTWLLRQRPVEAQSTRAVVVYTLSVADLPAPTTCRRLRHNTDATVSWRHVATRRTVNYRVDTCHVNDDNLAPAPRASYAAWLRCIYVLVAC